MMCVSLWGGAKPGKYAVRGVTVRVRSKKSKILGIVGKKDGYATKNADISILVPTVDKKLVTPHTESFQAVIWHCLVSHPILQIKKTKW